MPVNRAKVLDRAEKLVRQGKLPAAIAEFRTLLNDQPSDLNTINRLGDLLAKTGKTSEAIELFARAAHLYTVGGFFLKAIAIYKKILKLNPSVIDPRMRLADLYARRDLTTEARSEYIAAAEMLVRDGQEMKAREVYEKLIRMEPGNVKARTALADIYLGRGDIPRAVGELRAAARDLEGLGLKDESLLIHRRILDMRNVEVGALADSARCMARLGDADRAIEVCRALRKKHSEEMSPVEALVEALELAGQNEEAEELVKSSLGDNAEEAVPRAVLGRLHARAGRTARAEPLLLGAGRDLIKAGRFEEASKTVDLLLEILPGHRAALEQRLEVARALGATEVVAQLSDELGRSAFGEMADATIVRDIEPVPEPAPVQPILERALTREEKDFLNEHMTEAEVFVKYGLLDKAIEPLLMVLSRFPTHLEAHVRLKGIYGEQGNRAKFVDRCLSIAELHERGGRNNEAITVLNEARNLDPDHPVVRGRLDRLGGVARRVSVPPPAPAPRAHATPPPESELEISVDDEEQAATHAASAGDGAPADAYQSPEDAIPLSGDSSDATTADALARDLDAEAKGFFDLAGEFGESLAEVLQAEGAATEPAEEQEFGEIFRAFQQKVGEIVDSEDFKTHYDLAIAYKEMGLIDEAIAEFQYAARDESRLIDCCTMLGLCFREKGMPAQAEKWYLKALQTVDPEPGRELGLRFELAETYLEMGDYERAKEGFKLVAGIDSSYRDVAARLQEVEGLA